jgi:alpha-L-rhamnosidase
MKQTFIWLLAIITAHLLLMQAVCTAAQPTLGVEALRCEYLVNPLGIDVKQPRLSWRLSPGPRGRRQSAYRVLVASTPENLRKDRGDLWDSGRVNSEQSTFVVYKGRSLTAGRQCYWKVRVWDNAGGSSAWSRPALWTMGLLQDADWTGRWIGMERPTDVKEGTPLPFPWLRKTFSLPKRPQSATAYVNALGYYELYINGKKVEDHVLSPAVSDFSKRNLYVTYDVTKYLVPGKNCVALWLGRGWYVRGHPGVIHDGPLVRAQMDIALSDAPSVRIETDSTWKVQESPIRPLGRGLAFGDYGGEHYDAQKEIAGWNSVAFDDSAWKSAALFDPPKVVTAAQSVEPNRIMETISPVNVREQSPGVYLFDMGRNLTGWFELRLPPGIPSGTTLKLEYSDFPPVTEGRWRTHNQRDEYVTRDGAGQVFRSRFNYHGFGYVRVTGLTQPPSLKDARGYLIHTAYETAGAFTCSNDLLNRIHAMVTRTYRCLTLGGYVVDCPTRERLGYGGDAGTSMETGMFNFGTGALYTRWADDWRDAQHPETGDLPFTAPSYQDQGGGGPMWSGFVVTMPWQMYVQYGDRRILETSYPMMQKWLGYLQSETVNHLIESHKSYRMRLPQWTFLGDWLAPRPAGGGGRGDFGDLQAVKFINNCHHVYQLDIAAKIAALLGKNDDAAKYRAESATLRRLLHERFFVADKQSYATGEQPYLAFPLLVGVVPSERRAPVMQNLEETIGVKDGGHINAGMHGTYFLLKYLLEAERNDLIYEIVSKTDYPGWGYMLSQGATTSWESWTGGGSRIHDTLISVGGWFYQGIGGIRADEKSPGFRHFFLNPAPVGDLTFARTRYQSLYGPIVSDWKIKKDVLALDVTVPVGTTATVALPTSAPATVTESGRPVAQAVGVRAMGVKAGRAMFRVESGKYSFTCKLSR